MRKLFLLAAAAGTVCAPSAAVAQQQGDRVLVQQDHHPKYATWYRAVVQARSGDDHVVTVHFNSGATAQRLLRGVRPYNWRVGSQLVCNTPDAARMGVTHDAVITAMSSDGATVDLRFDHGGERHHFNPDSCYQIWRVGSQIECWANGIWISGMLSFLDWEADDVEVRHARLGLRHYQPRDCRTEN